MGCCLSTAADRKTNGTGDSSVSEKDRLPPPPPAPATAILEEETVKEVLSETTTLTTSSNNKRAQKTTHNPVTAKIHEEEVKPEILKAHLREPGAPTLNPPDPAGSMDKTEDESEVSEICSLSVSVSVSESVSTISKREDAYEEEVNQKQFQPMRRRSPVTSKNRVVGNHPTRRVEWSPAKKKVGAGFGSGSVRFVQPGRDSGAGIGSRSGPGMRDPAERSGRRSRSPATNRSVPSPTKNSGVRRKSNNQSPGRARMDANPSPNPTPAPNNSQPAQQKSKWASCSAAAGNYHGAAANESLENPLVSLECFIFL